MLISPSGNVNVVCIQERLRGREESTFLVMSLESMSLVQSSILNIIIKHILRAYYVSGSLLGNANTEVNKIKALFLKDSSCINSASKMCVCVCVVSCLENISTSSSCILESHH